MTYSRLSFLLLTFMLGCYTDRAVIERACRGERCVNVPADGGVTSEPMAGTLSEPPKSVSSSASGSSGASGAAGMSSAPSPEECVVQAVTPHPKPLAIHFLINKSWNVFSWYTPMREALDQFLWDPKSAGLSVGLTTLGAGCSPEVYEVPTLPIAAVPNSNAALLAALPAFPEISDEAVPAGLRGTLTYADRWSQQHADTKTIVVLMTQDLNDDCDSREDDAVAAAREGFDNDSIPTYVIAFEADLHKIAEAGGTGRAREVARFQTPDVLAAITSVRDAALPPSESVCRFATPAGEKIDATHAYLHVVGLDGSEITFKALANATACSLAVDGFYFDATAGTIVVCDSSCGRLRGAAKIELLTKCDATRR